MNGQDSTLHDHNILNKIISEWNKFGFKKTQNLINGILFENDDVAIIIDINIFSNKQFFYDYYTEEQNELMYNYKSLYRFVIDDETDLKAALCEYIALINNNFSDTIKPSVNRMYFPDPTSLEAKFEDIIENIYGNEVLSQIEREYPILDTKGQTRFIDYAIINNNHIIGIEINSVEYHHPQIIGKDKYKSQLLKQNSIVAQNIKLYRISSEEMQFTDRLYENLRKYFGSVIYHNFKRGMSVTRNFQLYEHQEISLQQINKSRLDGSSAFLVVFPTGTGKTKILMEDIKQQLKKNSGMNILCLAPRTKIVEQLLKNIKLSLEEINLKKINVGADKSNQIIVQTYAWISRHYLEFTPDKFQYIAIDEAHHAVAPTLIKVIHYFNTQTLIGLTATPDRLDRKQLSYIFGEYTSQLSLKDAIKKKILVPIRAYRLKSNVDLSRVRYNGKDYTKKDLQQTIIVPSRDELIVKTIIKYFDISSSSRKSGIIFCVNIKHADSLAQLMKKNNISAESVHSKKSNYNQIISDYQNGKIQFLCTVSLLSEGWDSPRTSIIIMARPTMSKVLYLQQIGRGTRKYKNKEALYLIDVVDNYNQFNVPWSIHAILDIRSYYPFGDVLNPNDRGKKFVDNGVTIILNEDEQHLEEINIFTFNKKYEGYLSTELLARELFVSTSAVNNWIKNKSIAPDVSIPFGKKILYYFHPQRVAEIREKKGLKIHNETTQYQDFLDFIAERSYSLSYKMIFILSLFKLVNKIGECDIDDLVELYRKFYKIQLDHGLAADRSTSKYNDKTYLYDNNHLKKNMLANPFEKFERKRFLYYAKDLKRIAIAPNLWRQLTKEDITNIQQQMFDDLEKYYSSLGGIYDMDMIKNIYS